MRVPEATGPWVARSSGVPLSKIYEVMARLAEKGFALCGPDAKPRKYKAVDPSISIEAFVEARKSRLENAKTLLLARLSTKMSSEQDRSIWIVKGQYAVETLMTSLIRKASNSVVYRHSSDRNKFVRARLEEVAAKGIAVDSKPSETTANLLNVDGRELLVYASKGEVLWIRDPRYLRRGE